MKAKLGTGKVLSIFGKSFFSYVPRYIAKCDFEPNTAYLGKKCKYNYLL